jgi:hypothetical protein
MSVTITVDDPLAGQLRSEAQQQRVSVQELATDLLSRALADSQDVVWRKANQRRLALIHKSSTLGLTPSESEELQQLQLLADQFLEASDAGRLAEVQRMEQEVRAALHEAGES